MALGYIPQICQLVRTRSYRDINLQTYLSILVGITFMEAYAFDLVRHGTGLMFFITNSASMLIVLTLCVLIIWIKKGAERNGKQY